MPGVCFSLYTESSQPAAKEEQSFKQEEGTRLEFSFLLRATMAVIFLAFVLLSVMQSCSPMATSKSL